MAGVRTARILTAAAVVLASVMWLALGSCGRATGGVPETEGPAAAASDASDALEPPAPLERERVIALGEVSPPRMAVLIPGRGPARPGVLMLGGTPAGPGAAVGAGLARRGHTVLRLPRVDGERAFEALWRLCAVEGVEPRKAAVLGHWADERGTDGSGADGSGAALDVAVSAPERAAALILLWEAEADRGAAEPAAWVEERTPDLAALSCPVLFVLLAGGDEEAARMRDQLGALASALDRAGSRDYTVKLVVLDGAAEPGSDPAPPADFIGQWLHLRLGAAPPGLSAE